MTPRQHELLVAIRDGIDRTGCCPTYPDLAVAVGLGAKSKGCIANHIKVLVAEGHLVRPRGKHSRDILLAEKVDLATVPTKRLLDELKRRGRAQ